MQVVTNGVVSAESKNLSLSGPAAHVEVVVIRLDVDSCPNDQWLHLFGLAHQHVGDLIRKFGEETPRFFRGEQVCEIVCWPGNRSVFLRWFLLAVDDTNAKSQPNAECTQEIKKADELLGAIDRMLGKIPGAE